eukprot:Phypoly_transcript_13298.p2 GENE.Phypoly_transcript_13298~~Phypoly_transcript_13298.p2  ORF type:complete len:111 (+),score=7.54 Phypoly_transcript_13298:712-1044(+)
MEYFGIKIPVFIVTYDGIKYYYEGICRIKDRDYVPGVLIATKVDLEAQRTVSTEEGRELAQKLRLPFFETSSKECINVAEVFKELVWIYLRMQVGFKVKENTNSKKCLVM